MSSNEDIKSVKVWITDKGTTPSGTSFRKKVSASDLDKPFQFDIWADFISDGKPKKKVGDISFMYDEITPPPENKPPIANAGIDQSVKEKTVVTLDGSGSSDPDGNIVTYQWTQTAGKTVQLVEPNSVKTTFVAPEIVEPNPEEPKPIFTFPSQPVKGLDTVTLNGTSSIADWLELVQTAGTPVVLNEVEVWKWQFTAPDEDVNLQFEGKATKGIKQAITQISIQVTKQGNGNGGEEKILWDSNVHLKTGQKYTVTDTYGSQAPDGKGVFMAASGSPRLIVEADGTFALEADAGHGRVYIKAKNYNARMEGEIMFPDDFDVVRNSTWRLRSRHNMGGDCSNRFGGFGATCEVQEQLAEYATESCHNNHENTVKKALQKKIEKGKWLKFKFWVCNDPTDKRVLFKTEYDYNDGSGFVTVLTGSHDNPQAFYMDRSLYDAESYAWLRMNNEDTGRVMYRNVRIVEIKSIPGVSSPSEEETPIIIRTASIPPPPIEEEEEEKLTFQLKVTDNKGATATDNVIVTVTKEGGEPTKKPPVADFTYEPIHPLPEQLVYLDGTNSLDPDGKISEYKWTSDNPNVILDNDSGFVCSFNFPPNTESVNITLKVTDNDGLTNAITKTITVEPPPNGEEIIIAHIGDTHGDTDGMREMLQKFKPAFIIHSGDITDTESDDDGYIADTKSMGLIYGKTFANSQGNHESPEESGEGAQEDMETAFPILKTTKWMQNYQIGNVFIIIGNTQISGYSQPDSIHMTFIKDSLAKAKQLRSEGKIDWVFYAQHKPYYTMKSRHDSEYNFRYNVHPLFDEAGLDISVHGHNHDMQRSKPIMYGGPSNTPPIINDKMINGDYHDLSQIPHGHINAINGSSTKNTSFSGDQDAWTVYADANNNAYSIYKIKGKTLIGQFVEIGTGKVLHEFKAAK